MPTLYERLLADPLAERWHLVEGVAFDGSVERTLRFSDHGFVTQPADSPASEPYPAVVATAINVSRSMFESERIGGPSFPSYGVVALVNTGQTVRLGWGSLKLEDLRTWSVDGRRWTVKRLGRLSDGTTLGYADAGIVFDGVGVGRPAVSDRGIEISVRDDQRRLEKPLQPNTYRGTGTCLAFAGGDYVDLNTHTTVEASAIEFGLRCDGTTGGEQAVIQVGTSWTTAGLDWRVVISAAGLLEVRVPRGQGSFLTLSAGALNVADGKRRDLALLLGAGTNGCKLLLDGSLVAEGTQPGFTSLVGATLRVGRQIAGTGSPFLGQVDEVRYWKVARTQDDILERLYAPLSLPIDSSLLHGYWPLDDGSGSTALDKSGNAKNGTLGAAADAPTWTASLEGLADLAGLQKQKVLGHVLNLEPAPVDPARGIYQVSDGWVAGIPVVRSNANPLATPAAYSTNLDRGLVTLTGAPGGRISAEVWGESIFGAAVAFDGVNGKATTGTLGTTAAVTVEFLFRSIGRGPTAAERVFFALGSAWSFASIDLTARLDANGKLRVQAPRSSGSSISILSEASVRDMLWRRASFSVTNGTNGFKLYLDGDLVGEATPPNYVANASAFLTIGSLIGASFYCDVALDDIRVWDHVRTQEQIRANLNRELVGNESGLRSYTRFTERTGTTAANSVAGGVTFTFSGGATWTNSRCAAGDLFRLVATRYAGFAEAELNEEALRLFIKAQPADCGWLVAGGETCMEVLDQIVGGVGGMFGPARLTRLLGASRVEPPTGSPIAAFSDAHLRDEEIAPIELPPPAWKVTVLHGRNWSVLDAETVAGIVASNPDAYSFAVSEWRRATKSDPRIKTAYPEAREIVIESPLVRRDDAIAEAVRQLAIRGVAREGYRLPFKVQPQQLDINEEINVVSSTLGMAAGRNWRILEFDEVDSDVDLVVWA